MKVSKLLSTVIMLGCVFSVFANGTGESQSSDGSVYPRKNVSWIVPAPAGAGLDIPTRALVDNLDLGANVVIENIAGASNTIGTLEASNRPADGYTILTGNSSGLILQPLINDLSYDPEDFRTIALLRPMGTFAVVVNPGSPIKTADDWISLVKGSARFTYSVPNPGNATHLAIVKALQELDSTSGVYVPYTGTAQVMGALQNGEVDFALLDTPDMLARDKVGDVRVLLVMDDKPEKLDPSKPIIADYGVEGMNVFYGFQLVAVHKDTPGAIVDYLKEKINAAIQTEAYQEYLVSVGAGRMEPASEEEITETISRARATYDQLLTELEMK